MTLPSDPADLFARLVSTTEFNFDRFEAFSWLRNEQVRDIAELIEETALNSEEGFATDSITGLLDVVDDDDDYRGRVFSILVGLDRALMYANPFYGTIDQGALTRAAVRYGMTGVPNSNVSDGALLPRASFPGRRKHTPNTLNDAFVSVVWVPPHEWQRADHCRAPARNDFTRREREAGLSIVCVPAITDAQELEWDAYDRGGGRFFRTRLSESSRMRDHVRRLLDDLDLSGAMIALLPELALDTALLNEWKEAVLDGAYPPSESQLKWIVAGTGDVSGGDRPVNRCVVLDRITGEEVLTQDKIFPFVLTNAQLDEWKLADLLGEADIEEDIDPGQRIAVLESRLGRVVVLICEDLARLVDLGSALRAHGISHVFSPVFSNETKPHHWEHVKAKEYVNEVGALVVVANSLVVSKRMTPAGPWGTALVHSPATTQLRATENWNDRATFQIVAGDPVPLHGDYSFAREDDDYFDAHE